MQAKKDSMNPNNNFTAAVANTMPLAQLQGSSSPERPVPSSLEAKVDESKNDASNTELVIERLSEGEEDQK